MEKDIMRTALQTVSLSLHLQKVQDFSTHVAHETFGKHTSFEILPKNRSYQLFHPDM